MPPSSDFKAQVQADLQRDIVEYMAWFEARGISLDYVSRDKRWRVSYYISRDDRQGWSRSAKFSDLLLDALRLGWADSKGSGDWPMKPKLKFSEIPR